MNGKGSHGLGDANTKLKTFFASIWYPRDETKRVFLKQFVDETKRLSSGQFHFQPRHCFAQDVSNGPAICVFFAFGDDCIEDRTDFARCCLSLCIRIVFLRLFDQFSMKFPPNFSRALP